MDIRNSVSGRPQCHRGTHIQKHTRTSKDVDLFADSAVVYRTARESTELLRGLSPGDSPHSINRQLPVRGVNDDVIKTGDRELRGSSDRVMTYQPCWFTVVFASNSFNLRNLQSADNCASVIVR
jgi:hypothetical protein